MKQPVRLTVLTTLLMVTALCLGGCGGGGHRAVTTPTSSTSAIPPTTLYPAEVSPANGGGLLGDMDDDGQPSVGDAIKILRIVVGLDDNVPCADANENDSTDVGDAILVLRCVVGLEPWPIGGGTITDQQREVALQAIDAKFQTLEALPRDEQNQQMAAFMAGRPEFEESGFSDTSCAWGRFKDGRLVIIINNCEPEPVGTTSVPLARPSQVAPSDVPRNKIVTNRELEPAGAVSIPVVRPSQAVPRSDMPANKKCVVCYSFGTAFVPPLIQPIETAYTINSLLAQRNYDSAGAMPATVEVLKYYLKDVGVFYFEGHGGSGRDRAGNPVFGVWTATLVSVADDIKYKDDLDNHRLVYMHALQNLVDHTWVDEWHYGITSAFVSEYMSFSRNSLVFINSCHSRGADASDFQNACHTQGACLYAGWTQLVVVADAFKAAPFLFDRLLGTNAVDPKENPPQRPFDYVSVWEDMKNRGLDTSTPAGSSAAKLEYYRDPDNGDFGLLAPSIRFVAVDEENQELHLGGMFGHEQSKAKVKVGGQQLQITQWQPGETVPDWDWMNCKLPCSGPGSAGDVVVEVDGHESNAKQLSDYRGTFTLKGGPGLGTVKAWATANVHLRSALQECRPQSGQPPLRSDVSLIKIVRDSTGSYGISGSYTNDYGGGRWTTYTYSGSGTLPAAWAPPGSGFEGPAVWAQAWLYWTRNKVALWARFVLPCHFESRDQDGTVHSDDSSGFAIYGISEEMPWSANYSIQGGKVDPAKYESWVVPFGDVELTWPTMTCHFPPNPMAPCSASWSWLPSAPP